MNLTKDEIQAILSAEDMMINMWAEPRIIVSYIGIDSTKRWPAQIAFEVSEEKESSPLAYLRKIAEDLGYSEYSEYNNACERRPVEVLDRIYDLARYIW